MRIAAGLALSLAMTTIAWAQGAERITEGNLVMENIPDIPEAVRDRLQQFQNTRSAGFQDFVGPDGGILISTRFGETTQIHHVAEPMGYRRQLTFFDERVGGASYRPSQGGGYIFTRDTGGDEMFQAYFFDLESGETTRLTEAATRNGGITWSDDGERVAWYRALQGEADWDILAASVDDPEGTRTVVLEGDGAMYPLEFSPDGTHLLIGRYYSIQHSEIHLLDLESGTLEQVNPDVEIAYGSVEFDPSGDAIWAVSDQFGEFRRITRIDLATGEVTPFGPDHGWDISSMDLSPDGSRIAYVTNSGGLSELHMIDVDSGTALDVPELPVGLMGGLSFDEAGERIGVTFVSATSPADAYTFEVGSTELVRWTQSEVGGLDTSTFVSPDLIEYETFDGRMIPAFYFRPESDEPLPVIVSIHGGPESQYRPGFSSTFQYWTTELGAAVIAPNVRGSSGYGSEYVALDNGFNREDSVRDIGALLDWIAEQPELDASRVVVYGGSYGGYMVLASLMHYNDRLAGGVNIVGISNFVTFLENTSGYRRDLRRAEYGDERDPDMNQHLQEISPSNHADRITSPLFIIQGANDPRVPASEAEQILAAVREAGGDPWYLLALDEGHGFSKRSNQDFMREAVTMFLMDTLELE
jgi:dipeptidyl aminopeptidase/acylaminoacyl peptidase